MDKIINNEELLKSIRNVNWEDAIRNVRPTVNVKPVDVSRYVARKDDRLDINMVLKKVDKLQALVYKEPVNNNDIVDIKVSCDDYLQEFYNGLEIAISLLEDREAKLID